MQMQDAPPDLLGVGAGGMVWVFFFCNAGDQTQGLAHAT